MMSLDGPIKREYTEEESRLLKHKFITLLYLLLIIYLTLHQFLIPLISNLFRGHNVLIDIHWIFLIHFYGYHKLNTEKELGSGFYTLLCTVTILEITVGVLTLGKWGLFSLALTQASTLIFLYFAYSFVSKDRRLMRSLLSILLGVVIVAGLKSIERRSEGLKKVTERRVLLHQESFVVSFPNSFPLSSENSVWKLGNKVVSFDKQFKLFNDNESIIDIRLYEMKVGSQRLSWKYNRLAQLKPHESWDLPLKNDRIYLIKSPERKDLHVLILVPRGFDFPLGVGDLSVGFNTLEWRGDVGDE